MPMSTFLQKLGTWLAGHPLKDRRRAQLLRKPFPAIWHVYLQKNFTLYSLLPPEKQSLLRSALSILVAEREWEGCGGLSITDEIRVTIAGQASLLLLGMEHDYFSHVPAILVYPTEFLAVTGRPIGESVLQAEGVPVVGEAWKRGPVILAWDEVLADGRGHDGRNVVFHEFAHQIDFEGVWPHSASPDTMRALGKRWNEVMTQEFDSLVSASERGRATVLDQYGATSPAEFFAVATECFFCQPSRLRRRHPRLYELLIDLYGQDPAASN
jgi:Mlc titration factor MtfA (ptsG expression regulator)